MHCAESNTAINNVIDEENTIAVYPNPFNDKVNITRSSNKAEQASLALYDLSGKLIRSFEFGAGERSIELNTTDLSAGVYLIRSKGNKSLSYFKVVKY